jgi:hypothetical protein
MAKSPKLPARAVDALPPQKWVPLIEAFARVKSVVGTDSLAAHDLTEHGRKKRLIFAARRIMPDAAEARLILAPEFWQPNEIWAEIKPPAPPEVDPRVEGNWYSLSLGSWHYFVRRAELDKHYPPLTPTPRASVEPDNDPLRPPPRRRGPTTTHDWHSIDGEIARRCIDPKSGRVKVPKNESALARDMLTWCQERGWEEPADSAMREAVRCVCAALRSVQK